MRDQEEINSLVWFKSVKKCTCSNMCEEELQFVAWDTAWGNSLYVLVTVMMMQLESYYRISFSYYFYLINRWFLVFKINKTTAIIFITNHHCQMIKARTTSFFLIFLIKANTTSYFHNLVSLQDRKFNEAAHGCIYL